MTNSSPSPTDGPSSGAGHEVPAGAQPPSSAFSTPHSAFDFPLTTLPARPCSYLPGRQSTHRAFLAGGRLSAQVYRNLMDAGFRRSGRLIYQPACGSCQQCIPLRVVVADFTPSKSQRRCRCRNDDLRITHGPPTITDQKWELYRRYLSQWHGRPVAGEAETTDDAVDFETFESFLYDSPVPTIEFEYRLPAAAGGQLLAVGICDISRSALSSVYFYFDPAHAARSLGTLGALHEIEWSAANDISHYYLGYWISGCGAMQYKASFRPHELLNPHGGWESPTEPTRDSP